MLLVAGMLGMNGCAATYTGDQDQDALSEFGHVTKVASLINGYRCDYCNLRVSERVAAYLNTILNLGFKR